MRKIRIRAALPAASAHTLEISSGMIALGFARCRFLISLRVRHAFVDALENLFFREPGIFQPADFRAAHGALALKSPVQDEIDGGIGKPHQPQHDGIGADSVQLIDFCNFQNHWFSVPRACEADSGIRAAKGVLVLVRVGNQSDASVVRDPRLFQFYELRDFVIGSVQFFQIFDVAGPHSRLIQRTIIRERMLIASARPEEDYQPEKHELTPHDSILSGTTVRAGNCALQGTRAKGQVAKTDRTTKKK